MQILVIWLSDSYESVKGCNLLILDCLMITLLPLWLDWTMYTMFLHHNACCGLACDALQFAAVGVGAIGAFLLARKIAVRVARTWRDIQAKTTFFCVTNSGESRAK